MNVIVERTAAVAKAREAVQNHCMCARYEETPHYVIAWYPEGYFPNGCRVALSMGKEKAMQKLIEVMEGHWQESMWWKA